MELSHLKKLRFCGVCRFLLQNNHLADRLNKIVSLFQRGALLFAQSLHLLSELSVCSHIASWRGNQAAAFSQPGRVRNPTLAAPSFR